MIYTQEVDNYLGLPETNGFDLAQKFEQHAKALEVPFISDEVDNVEKNTDGTWKITGASGTDKNGTAGNRSRTPETRGAGRRNTGRSRGVLLCNL